MKCVVLYKILRELTTESKRDELGSSLVRRVTVMLIKVMLLLLYTRVFNIIYCFSKSSLIQGILKTNLCFHKPHKVYLKVAFYSVEPSCGNKRF